MWLAVHLYVGLTFGAVFALLGLTGSILVFYNDIDAFINPGIKVTQPQSPSHSLSAQVILEKLNALHPERQEAWRIEMPLTSTSPVMARYYRPVETRDRKFAPLMVVLDPHTLEQTAARFWGDYVVTWIYDLHYSLLFEGTGTTIVGILGLIMLVSLCTGLYLWWPAKRRFVSALKPRISGAAARRNYHLHAMSGVYGWAVLLALAVTGAALALPEWARDAVHPFATVEPHGSPRTGYRLATEQPISLDTAVATARALFPAAEVRWIESSGAAGGPVSVRLHQSQEPGRRFAKTQVWIHPLTGAVLEVWNPLNSATGNRFLEWMHPIHNGEAFGLVGRWLVCISGVVPTILLVTGIIRWRQKHRVKAMARKFAQPRELARRL